jgi:hypothetical protein
MGKPLAAMGMIGLALVIESLILAHEVYVSPFVWTEAVGSMLVYLARFFRAGGATGAVPRLSGMAPGAT